jgi:hypothetical protein
MYLLLASEGAATGAEYALEQPDIIALNWLPAVTTIVVFLIAFGILYVKVWPMITKGLDDRQNKILEEIESAEEARAQAKEALAEYERELAGARDEAAGNPGPAGRQAGRHHRAARRGGDARRPDSGQDPPAGDLVRRPATAR